MLSVFPLLPSAALSRSLNYTDTDSERTNARVSAYLPVGFKQPVHDCAFRLTRQHGPTSH